MHRASNDAWLFRRSSRPGVPQAAIRAGGAGFTSGRASHRGQAGTSGRDVGGCHAAHGDGWNGWTVTVSARRAGSGDAGWDAVARRVTAGGGRVGVSVLGLQRVGTFVVRRQVVRLRLPKRTYSAL
ncbi:hypothetical protein GCM10008939_37340 [Deinococcus aquiradiocola]|uniref:Uncharacterized protein n=1 Tax=Deinococcus aquiradiocola TaxID=393059 RepID=A0A917PSV3_9DEIO|nr:hypothetical protein GCM10008939_37340 [Deinococcus aquiradiocola]